jgi:hypothetical protein
VMELYSSIRLYGILPVTVAQRSNAWTMQVTVMQTLAVMFGNDNIRIPELPLRNETVMQTFMLLRT